MSLYLFSDIIIGETTCDGKKKMYELLNEIKETYVLHLPQSQERSYAKDIWYEEVRLLKEKLEEKFDCTITEENLRKAAPGAQRAAKSPAGYVSSAEAGISGYEGNRDDDRSPAGIIHLRHLSAN